MSVPASAPLLRVAHLEVRYGDLIGVADVSLEVPRGSVVALLGSNGAGKTTTLNAIAGIAVASKGTVELDGENIAGQPAYAIVRKGLALSPEGWRLFTHRRLDRMRWRVPAWLVGLVAAAAFASCLTRTPQWPLPTGIGGVIGDAVIRAIASVVGGPLFGTGRTVAAVSFGVIAFAMLVIAAGFGFHRPDKARHVDDEDEEGEGRQAQDDCRRQLARAVAAAEVDEDCSAEQQQQSGRGQGTDHRHERPGQQAEDTEDLQESDPPVGRDAEAGVCGPGAHGRHGSEFRGAERREGDDEDAGEDSGCVHDNSL